MNLCKGDLIGIDSRLKQNPLASVVPAAPQESPVFVVMSSYPISPSRRSSWIVVVVLVMRRVVLYHSVGGPCGRVSGYRLITN